MAKKNTKVSFNKGNITFENGKYIITEFNKDSSSDYDLSQILDSFVGIDGVSLSIGIDDDIPVITEE